MAWKCVHTDQPHIAKGYCRACYQKIYYHGMIGATQEQIYTKGHMFFRQQNLSTDSGHIQRQLNFMMQHQLYKQDPNLM